MGPSSEYLRADGYSSQQHMGQQINPSIPEKNLVLWNYWRWDVCGHHPVSFVDGNCKAPTAGPR
jgi:hypothetical protein